MLPNKCKSKRKAPRQLDGAFLYQINLGYPGRD